MNLIAGFWPDMITIPKKETPLENIRIVFCFLQLDPMKTDCRNRVHRFSGFT